MIIICVINKKTGDLLRQYKSDRQTAMYNIDQLKKEFNLKKVGTGYESKTIEVFYYND